MLSQTDRDHIRFEEIFRQEVRLEIERKSPRPTLKRRLWSFLNSSFGIWILSSFVVGGLTFAYGRSQIVLERSREQRREIASLDREIARRLRSVAYRVARCNSDEAILFELLQSPNDPPDYEEIIREAKRVIAGIRHDAAQTKLRAQLPELFVKDSVGLQERLELPEDKKKLLRIVIESAVVDALSALDNPEFTSRREYRDISFDTLIWELLQRVGEENVAETKAAYRAATALSDLAGGVDIEDLSVRTPGRIYDYLFAEFQRWSRGIVFDNWRYQYTAVSTEGKEETGFVVAVSSEEAARILHRLNLFPTRIKRFRSENTLQLKGYDACPSITTVLSAWQRGLQRDEEPRPALVAALRNVLPSSSISQSFGTRHLTGTLAEEMLKYAAFFDRLTINMVAAGEAGNEVADAVERLLRLRDSIEALWRQYARFERYGQVNGWLAAMFWFFPFWLLCIGVKRHVTCPSVLNRLLAGLTRPTVLAIVLMGLCPLVTAVLLHKLDLLGNPLDADRKMRQQIDAHNAMIILGITMEGGIPILTSIELAEAATRNRDVRMLLQRARDSVSAFGGLADGMRGAGVLDQDQIDRIDIGEETGDLPVALCSVAKQIKAMIAEGTTVMRSPNLRLVMYSLLADLLLVPVAIVFLRIAGNVRQSGTVRRVAGTGTEEKK